MPRRLSTIQIARTVGVHPNTVRLYEQLGFLPPIPRAPNGYRLYTPFHLDQMRLARTALSGDYAGRAIRTSAVNLARCSASGDLPAALNLAREHLDLVRAELGQAEAAVKIVQRWADGAPLDSVPHPLSIGQVSALLRVTRDALRNWDRSGLLDIPRAESGYRSYGSAEISRLRVIRLLRSAGYSMMAILRMLRRLDSGDSSDLRAALDTPDPGEDAIAAADRWLTVLTEQEGRALSLVAQLEDMLSRYSP